MENINVEESLKVDQLNQSKQSISSTDNGTHLLTSELSSVKNLELAKEIRNMMKNIKSLDNQIKFIKKSNLDKDESIRELKTKNLQITEIKEKDKLKELLKTQTKEKPKLSKETKIKRILFSSSSQDFNEENSDTEIESIQSEMETYKTFMETDTKNRIKVLKKKNREKIMKFIYSKEVEFQKAKEKGKKKFDDIINQLNDLDTFIMKVNKIYNFLYFIF